nr:hypothetical protein CFP56_34768 [Quercus suber]
MSNNRNSNADWQYLECDPRSPFVTSLDDRNVLNSHAECDCGTDSHIQMSSEHKESQVHYVCMNAERDFYQGPEIGIGYIQLPAGETDDYLRSGSEALIRRSQSKRV